MKTTLRRASLAAGVVIAAAGAPFLGGGTLMVGVVVVLGAFLVWLDLREART
jgi:hypothetical protein